MAEELVTNDQLLPAKSKKLYETAYKNFDEWRQKHETKSFSSTVLLTYFKELSEKYKPSSLWSTYSMLRCVINMKEKIDIGKYDELTTFLKGKSEGFKTKKSSVLTHADIERFITEAPDNEFLVTKVILIFGICGACRKTELIYIKVEDITEQGNLLVVQIPTRPKISKIFTINSEFSSLVKKYSALRPDNTPTDRFFVNYRNGRCTVQAIGINRFAKMPQQIAIYLNLPNPGSYTGHSFRRSAATLRADSGTNILTLKKLGDLKSNTVAEEDIKVSVQSLPIINDVMGSAFALHSSSWEAAQMSEDQQSKRQKTDMIVNVGTSTSTAVKSSLNAPVFKFENCSVTIIHHNYANESKVLK